MNNGDPAEMVWTALEKISGGALPSAATESWTEILPKLAEPLGTTAGKAMEKPLTLISVQLERLAGGGGAATAALGVAQSALLPPVTQTPSGAGVSQKLEAVGESLLANVGSGLSLYPMIRGIVQLLSGSPEAPAALPVFTPPPSIQLAAGFTQANRQQISQVSYGQDGQPRSAEAPAMTLSSPVTVQVQAMDSRSFLDHSDEIARAVRDALLNSHTLGDLLTEI